MSTSNCKIDVWKDDNYSGDHCAFDGPSNIADLGGKNGYFYDNTSGHYGNVDDSISSAKTGSQAWCIMFADHNYEGDLCKMNHSTSWNDFSDIAPLNSTKGNMNDTVVSFKLFDYEPNYFVVNQPGRSSPCFVTTYANKDFNQANQYYDGNVPYTNAVNWIMAEGDIEDCRYLHLRMKKSTFEYGFYSMKTGPSTWVEVYSETHFGGVVTCFGPNSLVMDMVQYIDYGFKSMKIYSSEPSSWSDSTIMPPIVVTMQHYVIASKLESVLVDTLSLIPGVGGSIANLLDILWPTGPSTMEVWDDLKQYINTVMQGLIDEAALQNLDDKLIGLSSNLFAYESYVPGPEKASLLTSIITSIFDDEPYFLGGQNYANPDTQLTYQIAFCSIALVMLSQQAYCYGSISGTGTDPNQQAHMEQLNSKIQQYTPIVQSVIDSSVAWRTGDNIIFLQNAGQGQVVYDSVTGFIYGQNGLDEDTAQTKLNDVKAYIADTYRQQLSLYILPSYVWPYMNTNNTDSPQKVAVAYPVLVGTGSTSGSDWQDDLNGCVVTGVTLYAQDVDDYTQYICGIKFHYDNQGSGVHGVTGTKELSVDFDDGENIEVIYGRSGSVMDQLFFRTNQGRDFGLGGSGGDPFYMVAPQGVESTLCSIQGVQSGNYMASLIFNYTYQTYQ